jgi:hypothetical protein
MSDNDEAFGFADVSQSLRRPAAEHVHSLSHQCSPFASDRIRCAKDVSASTLAGGDGCLARMSSSSAVPKAFVIADWLDDPTFYPLMTRRCLASKLAKVSRRGLRYLSCRRRYLQS